VGYQSLVQVWSAEEESEDKQPGEAQTSKPQASIPHENQLSSFVVTFWAYICAVCSGEYFPVLFIVMLPA